MSGSERAKAGPSGRGGAKRKRRAAGAIVPLYKGLRTGPHKMGASGVARHQRIRMHGAMIEAISTAGYEETSVKLVVGLAGVSRRAFYQQFSNKEDCFIETFDLIVKRAIQRLVHAYRTASGDPAKRMREAVEVFMGDLERDPKSVCLVLVGAQQAGPRGLRRLHQTTAICEKLFSSGFSDRRYPDALPPPVVRAIVGGLRRTAATCVRDGETENLSALGREMLKWLLVFRSPAVRELRVRPCANPPFPAAMKLEPDACGGGGRRARLLRSAIEVGAREEDYDEVSAPRIADDAGLPIEDFVELFPDPSACYPEAVEVLGDELLQLVADPGLVSAEWSAAVCRTVDALLAHLAGSPARLVTLAVKALEAGARTNANVVDLAYEAATLLTEGAPRRARTKIAVEGIAGALWHTFYGEAVAGRGHRLPALSEYISYVVLTPFLGPEEAIEAIAKSRAEDASANGKAAAPGPARPATADPATTRPAEAQPAEALPATARPAEARPATAEAA